MLIKLEEPCIIVMDNASYHSVLSINYPKSNAIKADVQQWLREKGDLSSLETLSVLCKRVKSLILREKVYERDEIALDEMDYKIVHLPPYHCQYNSTELIFAQVKGEIAKNNTTFKFGDVEKLLHNALDSVSVDDWKKCTDQWHKLQDDDFIKEGLKDDTLA